jgi:ClpP class serine protease
MQHINFGTLIWIFFILLAFQPMLQQKMLGSARLRLIRSLERRRTSRVIAMIHRQESMSLLGFPLIRYIDIQDSEEILRAIKLTGDSVPIDLVLHTPGGLVLAAEQIAHAIKRHPAKTTVFVPHYAMSGGTLLALAADEIIMDPNAVLGPVDPQLGTRPAAALVRTLEAKGVANCDDETVILADTANMALSQVRKTVVSLLEDKMSPEAADALAEQLSQGCYTHDHSFTVDDVKGFGLDVSTDMPAEIYQLMELHPQPKRQLSTVEYIPVPYRANHGKQG